MIGQRHYGMDWLRVGAFAILILYHTGMVFVPWDFHIKSAVTYSWVEVPMRVLNPWRLCLLFVVSGFASRNLLSKRAGMGAFLQSRASRLGLPLLLGIAVIVPPQSWVQLTLSNGYGGNYLDFWLGDYFRFGTLNEVILPTWNHLWFVVYLLVYTLLLGLVLGLMPVAMRGAFQRGFDRATSGSGLIVLPVGLFLAQRVLLYPIFDETHALVDDWGAHFLYLGCFLFGFGLAGSPAAWKAIRTQWRTAAVLAVASGVAFQAFSQAAVLPVDVARSIFAWTTIVALIGIADRYWNRDHASRKTLTEAVFPFYMIHQTIIILTAWAMQRAGVGGWLEFAAIVVSTAVGCWLFYDCGRRIGWLRPWIGLQRQPASSATPLSVTRNSAQPNG